MEQHKLGSGTILLRQMFSAESLTRRIPAFRSCFRRARLIMASRWWITSIRTMFSRKLSALYTLPLSEKVSWDYMAPVGGAGAWSRHLYSPYFRFGAATGAVESSLGRDSTHTSFGVVTTGLRSTASSWKVGVQRTRTERRTLEYQPAALDSWSVRGSVAPNRDWVAQYSIGHLDHPEALEPWNQWRQTASVEYNHSAGSGQLGDSLVWGRVHEIGPGTNLNGTCSIHA